MNGALTHRFAITLRPLRDRQGERHVVHLNARTASQATREATARWPMMKVIEVSRESAPSALELPDHSAAEVAPLRRVGS